MSQQQPQAGLYVDEHHVYSVQLGDQPVVVWSRGWISLRLYLPYDGRVPLDRERDLKDVPADLEHVDLGTIQVTLPGAAAQTIAIPVAFKAGGELPDYLRGGGRMRLNRRLSIGAPVDTLISIDANVFDGADQERLPDLVLGRVSAFSDDIRLRLSLWAPNLLVKVHQANREREIRQMLLEQQSERQALTAHIPTVPALAQQLVALANRPSGGRLLVGVDSRGHVVGLPDEASKEELELALLKAALLTVPIMPVTLPEYFRHSDGRVIARVILTHNPALIYRYRGVAYRYRKYSRLHTAWARLRRGLGQPGAAAKQLGAQLAHPRRTARMLRRRRLSLPIAHRRSRARSVDLAAERPKGPAFQIVEALKQGNTDDVVMFDASKYQLETLPLDRAICALVNAGQPHGRIVIRSVSSDDKKPEALKQALHRRLRRELLHSAPMIQTPAITVMTIDQERIVVIQVAPDGVEAVAPVMLLDDKGYVWSNREIRPIAIHDLLERYQGRVRSATRQPGAGYVHLTYGELSRAVQPPQPVEFDRIAQRDAGSAHYDVQRQAVVWGMRQFEPEPDTDGLRCNLSVPMRHALTALGVDDKLGGDTALRGLLQVRFDDVLASGTDVKLSARIGDDHWLANLPIYKSTRLRLETEVYPQELFDRRSKMSMLHFRIPDVTLDRERVADLKQACADLGFRVYNLDARESDDQTIPMLRLQGIRSKEFCDIQLFAGIICERTQLSRTLQYERRTDRKHTQVAMMDVRVVLWGSGDKAPGEIAVLHHELYGILNQRLRYLRTE